MFQSPKCEIEISNWITPIPRVGYPLHLIFPLSLKVRDRLRLTVLEKELGKIHIYLDTKIFMLAMLRKSSNVS